MQKNEIINRIDKHVKELYSVKEKSKEDKEKSLLIGINLADEIMKAILFDEKQYHDQLTHDWTKGLNLPTVMPQSNYKHAKQKTWFIQHPFSSSHRLALEHFKENNALLESKFFAFSSKETKQKIAASTEFSDNWEDSKSTKGDTSKVGIDFFLSYDTNSLFMVITNQQKLRVMEFKKELSNTQKKILDDSLIGLYNKSEIDKLVTPEVSFQAIIHQRLWDALALKEVNKEFYKGVAELFVKLSDYLKKHGKDDISAKQFSSRLIGRMLFVWFLKEMNLINPEIGYFDGYKNDSTSYYHDKLVLLFFKTLNTEKDERLNDDQYTPFLNGGLFEAKNNDFLGETVPFPKNYFADLYSHFNKFNFTTDESSSDYEQVAVDPEMLGQVFESLLASQIDDNDDNQRNKTGAFYTPREIVDYMCKETLRLYLYDKISNEQHNEGIDFLLDSSDADFERKKSTGKLDLWGNNSEAVIDHITKALDSFTVLDPACGSGAYPMGMLQLLVKTYERITKKFDRYKCKKQVIEYNIFGVDIEPMATEISRLRAWLSVVVDEKDINNVKPLPNLEFKFLSANSLVKLEENTNLFDRNLDMKLVALRDKFFNARTSHKKQQYKEEFYELTNFNNNQIDLFANNIDDVESKRVQQLKTFDPFANNKAAEFFDAHYMFGIEDGFDAIIGNPPYVSAKSTSDSIKKILKKEFGFADDLYSHFFFVGMNFLKENGNLTYITSNTYWTIQTKRNLREMLLENYINYIYDTGNPFDSAMVDTAIICVKKSNLSNENIYFFDGKSDFQNPLKYNIKQEVYINVLNNVFFIPTENNMKINEKYGKELRELHDKWWDKISTSKKIEKNMHELQKYRDSLKPGDITLLGLVTEGGQGLATANNGKYIGVKRTSKWAERIIETRPVKLEKAIKEKNINCKLIEGLIESKSFLSSKTEKEIHDLFDALKEKYGRDIFGQGYLYKIIDETEIVDVNELTEDEKTNGISTEKKYYVPYDKGDRDGNRWYLDTPFAIAWSKENVHFLKTDRNARYQGYMFYFKEGFSWSLINGTRSSNDLKFRISPPCIRDVGGMSLHSVINQLSNKYIICLCNSIFMNQYTESFINFTVNFQINDARLIPIIIPKVEELDYVEQIFTENYNKTKYSKETPNNSTEFVSKLYGI